MIVDYRERHGQLNGLESLRNDIVTHFEGSPGTAGIGGEEATTERVPPADELDFNTPSITSTTLRDELRNCLAEYTRCYHS